MRLFDSLARWRVPALVLLAIVTCLLASQIPSLRAVFAPEALVPPAPEDEARSARLLDGFAGREEPILVLVEAPDVLAPAPLGHLHRAARHFARQPWCARVEGLTTTPLPRDPHADRGVTLDSLEAPDSDDDALEGPLARLVASDPAHFPAGLLSVSERTGGGLALRPLVDGDRLDAAAIERVRTAIARSPSLRGRLVDREGRLAVLALVVRAGADEEGDAAVRASRAWLEAHPAPAGVSVQLGGLPVVRADMVDALARDQLSLVAIAVMGSVLVLLVGFRTPAGVLLPLGAAGMTSAMVVGAMAIAGEPINLLNNVVPPLLITVGIGDSVHLLVRYREELERGADRLRAAQHTMRAMAGACFLTSITTAVGFASLVVSDTDVLRRFAITAALGVMLAYVVTVVFLPAALPSFEVPALREQRTLERWIGRAADLALRRPRLLVGLSLALVVGSLALGTRVRVDSALLDQIDPASPAALSARLLEDRLEGVRRLEIVLEGEPGRYEGGTGARELEALERWLGAQTGVLRATSVSEPMREVYGHLSGTDGSSATEVDARVSALSAIGRRAAPALWARYVSADGARARIEVRLADRGERHVNALLDRVEARIDAMPGVHGVLAGEAHRSARGLDRLVSDLVPSLCIAVLVIFVLLGVLLSSARLALVSVLPNLLPLATTLAYMALRGIPLHAGTAIVFTISIGLAVDGTIHVLARHREELRAGKGREEALRAAMRGSGRAVVIGTATLSIGFAALLFASFVPIRWFAELSITAIASAFVADLFVLPALLVLFGPAPIHSTKIPVVG